MCDFETGEIASILCDDSENENTSKSDSNIIDEISRQPKPKMDKWMKSSEDQFKILNPNDPLMKRFQDALKAHLTRIDNRLSEEIAELECAIKESTKTREKEGIKLYDEQQEAVRQQTAIETYQSMLGEVHHLREESDGRLSVIKESHKIALEVLQNEKSKEKKLIQHMEGLSSLHQQFDEWEKELATNLAVSQRMSEKDASLQRDMLREKQQKDYVFFKLMEEVWKLESEIKTLDEQLQIKNDEKIVLSQSMADANADLQALEIEQKNLYNTWNSVITNIAQRDKINIELNQERKQIRESFQSLQSQMENIKKETSKAMDLNEELTNYEYRYQNDIQNSLRVYEADKDKATSLEYEIIKLCKMEENAEGEYNNATLTLQTVEKQEKALNKEVEKLKIQKNALEDEILQKLDVKVMHDKAARYVNKLLLDTKDSNQMQELTLLQAENTYAKNLLEIEKINKVIAEEKFDLEEVVQRNTNKEKQIEKLEVEIAKCESLISKKERTIDTLNKKIDDVTSTTGGEAISPIDLKIIELEKSIEELEVKNQKSQQIWLRQEGNIIALSQQHDAQQREISLLNKQVMIMEQKNLKLEYELQKQKKEEANINRSVNSLQLRLQNINLRHAAQKELSEGLEDKNCITKIEYIKSLQDAEMDLIKLQAEIRNLIDEKDNLKDQLTNVQRESLSWEKKVQIAREINEKFKEERSAGGDVAMMKSEIHKMEMRLMQLRRVQEKLVQDMEFCVSRRDCIMDVVHAREKKNPKTAHNRRIVLRKRMDDQKTKIKQISKETKQIENEISKLDKDQKELLDKLNEGQKTLRENDDIIPDIDKQISEAEIIKHHNLEILIRKQRKGTMLQDLRNGRYKMAFKTETALNEELQNQRIINAHLNEIMHQTNHDFPLLENQIRKILLTLEIS